MTTWPDRIAGAFIVLGVGWFYADTILLPHIRPAAIKLAGYLRRATR